MGKYVFVTKTGKKVTMTGVTQKEAWRYGVQHRKKLDVWGTPSQVKKHQKEFPKTKRKKRKKTTRRVVTQPAASQTYTPPGVSLGGGFGRV
ncbi:hypothetical protein ES702_04936 [subsurface metagenome]